MKHYNFTFFIYFVCAVFLSVGNLFAEEIKLQNANYDADAGQIIVKGKLDGFENDQIVELYDVSLDILIATSAPTAKQFIFKLDGVTGQTIPCAVKVKAGAAVAIGDLKHAPSDCGKFIFSLTLAGEVRDAPIPFASISVTVNGQTFFGVADANGQFLIEITSTSLDSLVTIESVDPNDETTVMTSIGGTFSKLLEDSDGDGIVDGTENPNISTTPYTTALFVVLADANGGVPPATIEELELAEKSIDATEVLELAAVIKLIIDDPNFDIPIDPATGQPYGSVLEFISDSNVDGGGNTAVENFIADNSSAVQTAAEAILNDSGLVPGFAAGDIPDLYYAIVEAQAGFLSRSGGALTFNRSPDNGEILEPLFGRPLAGLYDWSVVNGQLVLDLTTRPQKGSGSTGPPFGTTLRCQDPGNPQFTSCPFDCADYQAAWDARIDLGLGFITVNRETTQRTYSRFASSPSGNIDFTTLAEVTLSDYEPFQYDPGSGEATFDFCDEFTVTNSPVELRNSASVETIAFTDAMLLNKTWAFHVYYDLDGADSRFGRDLILDLVTMTGTSPDADGYRPTTTLLTSVNPDWRIVDTGSSNPGSGLPGDLQFRYTDSSVQTLRILDGPLGLEFGVFNDVTDPSRRFGDYDIALEVDPAFAFTVPYLTSDPGEYWNGMINAWIKTNWFTNSGGDLEHAGLLFGWQLVSDFTGFNHFANLTQTVSWDILAVPTQVFGGDLNPLPTGTFHVNYVPWAPWLTTTRDRYWIPIADTTITAPVFVGAPAVRTRFYAVEFEYQDGILRTVIAPRINVEETLNLSIFPQFP